jgi:hypothetical protein
VIGGGVGVAVGEADGDGETPLGTALGVTLALGVILAPGEGDAPGGVTVAEGIGVAGAGDGASVTGSANGVDDAYGAGSVCWARAEDPHVRAPPMQATSINERASAWCRCESPNS